MKGRIFILLLVALLASSCCKDNPERPRRYDKVLIMYSAGCNSLSGFLIDDVNCIKKGYLPHRGDKKAFVLISHTPKYSGYYDEPTSAYVIKLSRKGSDLICDTLQRFAPGESLANAETMNKALSYVKKVFKTEHYGMVFSSHGSGWLPVGYYDNPVVPNATPKSLNSKEEKSFELPDFRQGPHLYLEPEHRPGEPMVKSAGQEYVQGTGSEVYDSQGHRLSYEMTMEEFAANIPMKLDYLLFDACLMGGIEVAYELKDVTRYLVFSPAEVLDDGYAYESMVSHLLENGTALQKVCEESFKRYDEAEEEVYRSATITLVDCSKLGTLSQVCKDLVLNYRDRIAAINPSTVQQYYRSFHHWYYDLEDIFLKAGISDMEKTRLENALKECIVYKAATPKFWYGTGRGGFDINIYSGFSMYLPCNGNSYLDSQYKSLAWNKAVSLVQ